MNIFRFTEYKKGSGYLTEPSNKKFYDGTVPSNKKLYDGTPKKGKEVGETWKGRGREGGRRRLEGAGGGRGGELVGGKNR